MSENTLSILPAYVVWSNNTQPQLELGNQQLRNGDLEALDAEVDITDSSSVEEHSTHPMNEMQSGESATTQPRRACACISQL
jgi:hypothetical protein